MDFAVNEGFLNEAKEKCDSAASEIDSLVQSIYSKIDGLSTDWSGSSYDEFNSSCQDYRPSMEQLSSLIRAFGVLIEKVQEPRETLESEIKKALEK